MKNGKRIKAIFEKFSFALLIMEAARGNRVRLFDGFVAGEEIPSSFRSNLLEIHQPSLINIFIIVINCGTACL
jgi:hypothetical protein